MLRALLALLAASALASGAALGPVGDLAAAGLPRLATAGPLSPGVRAAPSPSPDPTPSGPVLPRADEPATPSSIDPDAWAASLSPEPGPVPSPSPSPTPRPAPNLAASPVVAARAAAPLVSNGSRAKRVVAITVDDCYSPDAVEAYLAVFAREGVNATFFPVGEVVSLYPSLWRRVAAAGYPIANHTWSHIDLTKLSQAAIETEIRTAASVIRSVTGRPAAPFIRPMGGSWNQSVLRAAGRTGQASVVLWDVTSGDSGRGSAAQVAANASRGTNGSIVLLHANNLRSPEAVVAVIDHYQQAGFEFVTLGQLFGMAGPVPFPKAPATPTPSPSPSPTPTPTPSPTPTPTPSPTPAPSPAPTAGYEPGQSPVDGGSPGLGPIGQPAPTAWVAGSAPAGPLPAIDRSVVPPPADSWTAAQDVGRRLGSRPVSRSRRSTVRG